MDDKIFTTAGELFQEMKRRGMELRPGETRDNSLYSDLCARVKSPPDQLQKFLNESDMPADVFLRHFLKVARPFAMMFSDIWSYLNEVVAPRVEESIALRFGFPDDSNPVDVDLESFRRHVQRIQSVFIDVSVWPNEALRKLFEMGDLLIASLRRPARYNFGQKLNLPVVSRDDHPIFEVVENIRNVFQEIIIQNERAPAGDLNFAERQVSDATRSAGYLLTDLMPRWYSIFSDYSGIDEAEKNRAYQFYVDKVLPLLAAELREEKRSIDEALDILDLPFWKKRWHTYEIWATVKILEFLREYKPVPRIHDKRIMLDGYAAGIIADLTKASFTKACVAVQVSTPFEYVQRKRIKPDLRILFDDKIDDPYSTAAIIEFKQRKSLGAAYIQEILYSYTHGAPNTGGTVVINYDGGDVESDTENAYLLYNIQPANRDDVKIFKETLLRCLQRVSFLPSKLKKVLLLDVSGSMQGLYDDVTIGTYAHEEHLLGLLDVYLFHTRLVIPSSISTELSNISSGRGTDLLRALQDLSAIHPRIDSLLIVTDDGVEEIDWTRFDIGEVRKCWPQDADVFNEWRRAK